MAATAPLPEHAPSRRSASDDRTELPDERDAVCVDDASAQLELLSDDYARSILASLSESPKRGRDLIEACDGSRSTVYRRLNRLVDAGFVATEMTFDPDGHHCKTFRLVRDTMTVTVGQDGLRMTAR